MKIRILIVHRDIVAADNIKEILLDNFPQEEWNVTVDLAKNDTEARSRIENETYNLVITHLHIPIDNKHHLDEQEHRGLCLLEYLSPRKIPGILTSIVPDSRLDSRIAKLKKVSQVFEGSRFESELALYSKVLLDESREQEKELTANVELTLCLNELHYQYRIWVKGEEFQYHADGLLKIDREALEKLKKKSEGLVANDEENCERWKKNLIEIGEMLEVLLFKKNYDFSRIFDQIEGKTGNPENLKLRFYIREDVHTIFFEALRKNKKFTMLHSPLYRRPRLEGRFRPYRLGQKMNCLIIRSDTKGKVRKLKDKNGNNLYLDKLNHLKSECNWLKQYLNANRHRFNVGKIETIEENKIPGNMNFPEYLEEIIGNDQDQWDIVHYAGHSYYDSRKNEGYIFYPENSMINKLPIKRLALLLRNAGTRLIYLSSCQSWGKDVVFKMAQNEVPAIIGFRWEIDDDKAMLFTQNFYRNLLESKIPLENAFLKTRKQMYEMDSTNKIWAAPMLVMQVID